MRIEDQIEAWIDSIAAHNHANAGPWTARFELDGTQLVEQAVKRLDAMGVTMGPNGGPREYVATFPSLSAREVVSILVNGGARLSSDQTLATVP
ncbi:MAG: hypothetical protein ABIQ16_18765 [Polyangiaceae bacterium]